MQLLCMDRHWHKVAQKESKIRGKKLNEACVNTDSTFIHRIICTSIRRKRIGNGRWRMSKAQKLSKCFSMEKVMQKVNALGLAADELSLSDPCGMDALSEMWLEFAFDWNRQWNETWNKDIRDTFCCWRIEVDSNVKSKRADGCIQKCTRHRIREKYTHKKEIHKNSVKKMNHQ